MTLGNRDIIDYMGRNISEFNVEQVGPSSYDCRLGVGVKILSDRQPPINIPGTHKVEYEDIELDDDGYYEIKPFQFALATTEEFVKMPDNIDAHVDGRSSIGRLGLMVHVTAGYIDPGFFGQITLELFNATRSNIHIKPGAKICQLVFGRVSNCTEPYNKRESSKYNGQEGPTGSRLEMDNMKDKPRGIRNNNPGNIRENHMVDYNWEGEADEDWDPEFEEFITMAYGIRAIAKILITYRDKHKLKNPEQVIKRWAPKEDGNDTAAYIRHVERVVPRRLWNLESKEALVEYTKSICTHENGVRWAAEWMPYVEEGVGMAV